MRPGFGRAGRLSTLRPTSDIEGDVSASARELARRLGTSAGQMVSRQLWAALSGQSIAGGSPSPPPTEAVADFRPFPTQSGQLVTNDLIDQRRDEAGLGWPGPCSRSMW